MQAEERKDYCVYMHVDKEGVPFYVGSGTKRRAYVKEYCNRREGGTNRGIQYSRKVNELNFEYDVIIVKDLLSKDEAINLEIEMYNLHIKTLVNKSRPKKEIVLDKNYVESFVEYCESSPSYLIWVTDRNKLKGAIRGSSAGGKDSIGYRVKIENRSYLASRLIAILFGYKIEGKVVDHIDGNMFNNKIENLRVISYAENARNMSISKNNSSGKCGVSFHSGINRWIATWREASKQCSKSFSVDKYGNDTAFRLACEYRDSKIKELNEQGAGYTERHGT